MDLRGAWTSARCGHSGGEGTSVDDALPGALRSQHFVCCERDRLLHQLQDELPGAQLHGQLRPKAVCEVVVLHFLELVAHTSEPQQRAATSLDARTSTLLGGHAELLLLSSLGSLACVLRAATSPGDFPSVGCAHPSGGHWTSVLSDDIERGAELRGERPLQVLEPPLHRLLRERSQQRLRGATALHDFAGVDSPSGQLPALLRLRVV